MFLFFRERKRWQFQVAISCQRRNVVASEVFIALTHGTASFHVNRSRSMMPVSFRKVITALLSISLVHNSSLRDSMADESTDLIDSRLSSKYRGSGGGRVSHFVCFCRSQTGLSSVFFA